MKPRILEKSITWRYDDKMYTAKMTLTDTVEVTSVGELKPPSKGLGDTVKKVIDKVSRGKVKPCGGCKKRQEALNKILPYKGDSSNG
tara:strand:+ start:12482 stop:12742 length:261 start_codon:yes stop_codon:yes gene_type:complete